MTVVIVQCRLSSSRLPEKALLSLGGRPILAWTLNAMRQVPADRYILACDEESFDKLLPVASECGWECFSGPKDDVLERFCLVIEQVKADTVVRATADNPFLFYEAAAELLEQYKKEDCDYITWTGLPHGSGVEVFDAHSLLKARKITSEPYDHEHVGPALYNHPDEFLSLMLPSPKQWQYPGLRTTVDTYTDYQHARRIVRAVSCERKSLMPYTSQEICAACMRPEITHPVLCVPSVAKGRGTGHFRRCLSLAIQNGYDLYIPENMENESCYHLLQNVLENGSLSDWQILHAFPQKGDYSLILADCFMMEHSFVCALADLAPIAALDEGSAYTGCCDYLLDIIPSYKLERSANLQSPELIPLPLPEHRRPVSRENKKISPQRILICLGGEDPAGLTVPAALACASCGVQVSAIVDNIPEAEKLLSEKTKKQITLFTPIEDLREHLYEYDVVITHYGFTAFEAVAAGCGVLLLGTTQLHFDLGKKYGFAVLAAASITARCFKLLFANPDSLYPSSSFSASLLTQRESLFVFVAKLAQGRRLCCPVCRAEKKEKVYDDQVIARVADRTYRRCALCGMLYMSWTMNSSTEYDNAYFFEDYKKQYGRTYLEDFESIRLQGDRRISLIESCFAGRRTGTRKHGGAVQKLLALDVGCAMGPFLSAAAAAGWQVYGTDISQEAVTHVQNNLKYPAVCAAFPDFDPGQEFGIANFDVVTMWYVIEHFADLDAALRKVSKLVRKGGIFAFSTPSASGVSAKYFPDKFYAASPADHYTLWEPARTAGILAKYNFKIARIVSTGHHPKRFPYAKKHQLVADSRMYQVLLARSHMFKLGDTFEVYSIKESD